MGGLHVKTEVEELKSTTCMIQAESFAFPQLFGFDFVCFFA
jgi:hypothetical protein